MVYFSSEHQVSLNINIERKGWWGLTLLPRVYLSTILQPDTISQSVICTLRHQCHQPLIVAIKHGWLQIQISTIYNIYISIIVSTKGISLAHYTRPITVSLFLDISNLDSA